LALTYQFLIFVAGGLFEGGLFDDAPMGDVPPVDHTIQDPQNLPPPPDSDDDDMDHFGGPPSVGGHRYQQLTK
jgi:cohesin complex subunit SCC1